MVAFQFRVPRDGVATCQRHPADMHCRLLFIRRENHRDPLGLRVVEQDTRQVLLGALHQQPIKVDPRQLGMENTACSDDTLDPFSPEGGMVGIGVRESRNRTVRDVKGPPLCSLSREG